VLRLPGDRKYDFCKLEIEARVRVLSAIVASTPKELAGV
jgi:hypothetical protein